MSGRGITKVGHQDGTGGFIQRNDSIWHTGFVCYVTAPPSDNTAPGFRPVTGRCQPKLAALLDLGTVQGCGVGCVGRCQKFPVSDIQ